MGSEPVQEDEIRERVAGVLGVEPGSIGDDDDLVELGLNSILTMKLASGWRRLGLAVNFADLALVPTVRAWAQLLAERRAERPDAGQEERDPPAPRESAGDESEPFGLAVMQHGYWIGRSDDQALGGVAAHLYAEFDGQGLEPERLGRAVTALVRRHGMLRSQFSDDGTQRVLPEPALPVWSVTDLRDLGGQEVSQRLETIRDRKTHQRLRVDLGQVVDVSLTLLPGGRTRLHVDVDMLAADALSYRVLLADLAELYARDAEHLDGQGSLSYTYRQYLQDRAALDRVAHQAERAWWQERLPDLPDAPALPLVPESERADPYRTVRYDHWLDPQGKQRLLERAHRHGVTPAVVLASVFAEVVGGWSSQQRYLLNVPLFNREPTHPDVDQLVGDFTSSVLLDVDSRRPATVLERARWLQRSLHTSASHASYPGLDVLRDLGRYRGEPVLASVVYTSGLDLGELFRESVLEAFGEPVWIISQGPQVVLDAQVVELRGGLLLNWDVREQAFPEGLMEEMFARHREAVEALLADEASWDRPVPAGPPAGQVEVRRKVNDTARAPSGRLLHEGFFAWAEATPDAPAVVWGDEVLTFDEVRDRSLRLAGALAARGVRPGDAVSVQLPKGPDQIVAVLGVLAAGAAYVPLGADQPESRRERIQQVGDVSFAVTAGDVAEATASGERLAALVPLDTGAVAYVLFTSGSTGEPKGVEVTHAAAMNTLDRLNEHFSVGPKDRSLGLSALEFDLSVYDIFGLLSAGGSVIVVDDETRRDGMRTARLVREQRPTVLNCVPGLLEMLLEAGKAEGIGDSLRVVLLGGDWVGADLPARVGEQVPGCRFAGLGGTTETAIHSTVCEVTGPAPEAWKAVPYGVPLGNVRCRVVNERGLDCPDWVPGELWIGGASVALGYRNDPERTAERFVEHEGDRWYRTGDLARYWPDGTLEFLGRNDHQVKVRGHRVELGEVEAVLRSLPSVQRAVAELVGGKLLAAVTREAGADAAAGPEALRAAAAELLPPYMVPDHIDVLDELPLTGNGKLDRKAVRATLVASSAGEDDAASRPPETDLEVALADVLAQVLAVDQVGAEDDFFALGGDSVLATTAMARVREWLDTTEAAVSDLFASRTVRALAARLAAKQSTPGRLEQVAAVYLDVAAMSDDEAAAEAALA